MKKKFLLLFLISTICVCICASTIAFAAEGTNTDMLEPMTDIDFVVLANNQSTTVTADLSFPLDFEVVPVALIGSGNFSATLSKTNTRGEIYYIYLYGLDDPGDPHIAFNTGITPVSLRVSIPVSDEADGAIALIVHGLIFSLEDPPYEYSLSLSF